MWGDLCDHAFFMTFCCASENNFAFVLSAIRARERVLLKKAGIMQSFSISIMPIAPNVATVLSILLHIAFGNGLTIAEVSYSI